MSKPNPRRCETCEFGFTYGIKKQQKTVRCYHEFQPVKFHAPNDGCQLHRPKSSEKSLPATGSFGGSHAR